jgi:N-acetylmuramoyl-L-alanine amidase
MTFCRRVAIASLFAGTLAVAPAEAAPRKSECDHAAFRIVLDVGHTPESPGATSARGIDEYAFNFRLARRIERQLVETGFAKTILMVTEGPAKPSLADRVARANRSSADVLLSIHHDAVPDSFVETWEYDGKQHHFSDRFSGHSVFVSRYNSQYGTSLAFARLIGLQMNARGLRYTPHYVEKFMGKNRHELVDGEAGVYRHDKLMVLKLTHMPAVLLEAGSIVNRDDELLLDSAGQHALISAAVTDAVESFCALRAPQQPQLIAQRPPARHVTAHAKRPVKRHAVRSAAATPGRILSR